MVERSKKKVDVQLRDRSPREEDCEGAAVELPPLVRPVLEEQKEQEEQKIQ